LPRLNIFIQLLLCHSLVLLISVSAIPKRTEPTRPPTLQGNMVSLRLSRQVDAPNQCSSANKSVYKLVRYWHTCIALRVLRFATQFVTLLAAPTAFVRAATCVLHATSFISSFVTLHYTTFAALILLQGIAHFPAHRAMHKCCKCLFASLRYNTHWVSFRFTTSSIHFSRIQSTRCL